MKKKIKTVHLFYYTENKRAVLWKNKIQKWLNKNHAGIELVEDDADVVMVLGGDGTILEAANKFGATGSLIIGLNLGNVGFLASVRKPANFMKNIKRLFSGQYKVAERMMANAEIIRKGKKIFSLNAFNDIAVQSPLGMVELEVKIEDHPLQFIRGTGVLVSTSTGSTAMNLSYHGPIVTPDIKSFIITELADHNTPTPSIVIEKNRMITINVLDFREMGLLMLSKNSQKIDTVLTVDGSVIQPLKKKDKVIIQHSPQLIKFVEFEDHYFFKSLQEKFAFK
ncbi:MAG: hypothetical protein COV29_01825 [Candidatus Yanofskybacteria bacterium CG10_big_fil_rev_8_21_14_0_10_36_16]|uniref:NAD kinase n=1 Tax=Candidatus Yanofskybacteria bacterium CG10_big_fil_rev_8_21_14_0_10_36_16 TaxID=1975096 RepID=A0A2J0QA67_9BACT|nr:MAG: hypothetical protein COV29_01825 [Candidatus Yanofskybacteria bacterium CG10_big_fil_rev_8_21_14_0_10_36_16]